MASAQKRWRQPLPQPLDSTSFSVSDAIAAGVSAKQLRHSSLDRPFRGVRSTGQDLTRLDVLCKAYAVKMLPTHVFSHVTAARLMDLPLPTRLEQQDELHVSATAPGRAPQVRGVIGHQHSGAPGSVMVHRGLRLTAPEFTWASLASVLELDDLIALGDSLVSGDHPWSAIDRLRAAIAPGIRGATKLKAAVPLVRTGVRSRPETHLRLGIVRAGFPEPLVAHPVWVPALRQVVHPDLSWPNWRVGLEYEGDGHRTDRWQFRHDIRRVEGLVDIEWSLSRFTADDVYSGLAQTLHRTRLRLRSHGWPG